MSEFAPLLVFGILLVRIGMVVAMTPVFGGTWAPSQIKVGLVVVLAAIMAPLVTLPAIETPAALAAVVAREAIIGMALSMGIRVLVSAAELGGYLVGFQIGFSYAGIVDPQSGVRNNVMAVLYGTLTLMAVFGANLHHQMIRLLVATYDAVPVAPHRGVNESLVQSVMHMTGAIFVLGAELAAPVVLVLVLIEVVMGVVSRAAPSLNLMIVGAPIRLLVGLFALSAALEVVPGVITRSATMSLELASRLALAFK